MILNLNKDEYIINNFKNKYSYKYYFNIQLIISTIITSNIIMFHYKDNEFLKEYFGFFALPFILIGFYLLLRNNFVVRYSIAKEYYEYYLTNMHN